jgi:hypothetical protein
MVYEGENVDVVAIVVGVSGIAKVGAGKCCLKSVEVIGYPGFLGCGELICFRVGVGEGVSVDYRFNVIPPTLFEEVSTGDFGL